MQNPELNSIYQKVSDSKYEVKNWPIEVRKNILTSIKTWILKNEDRIADALFKDFKRPAFEAQSGDILPCISEINFFLKNLDFWTKPRWVPSGPMFQGVTCKIKPEAKGCVLIFGPWNYPFALSIVPLVAALAAGNTGILKPSELTPNTSQLVKELVSECCRPEHFSVVLGGADIANQLLMFNFDHIFFTGSPTVGKIVMKAAAEKLTSVTLELGGKSSAIVDASTDIKQVIGNIIFGKFFNNGQTCVAIDTLFVHESKYNEFISEFKTTFSRMYKNPNDLADVINQKNKDRILNLKMTSLGKIIPLSTEGELACLIESPDLRSGIMQEEIFGPLLPIFKFSSLEKLLPIFREQVSLQNPLALYIYSKDKQFQDRILNQIPSGGVCINECSIHVVNHHLPFGGHHTSGIGNYHGKFSFDAFTHQRAVLQRYGAFKITALLYAPYSAWKIKLIKFVNRWII